MSKHVNDVRASSADSRYAAKPFQGTIAQAKKQAAKAPEFGRTANEIAAVAAGMSTARYELLAFLRILP